MEKNYYKSYDPIVAHGIFPVPLEKMLFSNAPIQSAFPSSRIYPTKLDSYTSSAQQKYGQPKKWKKTAFALLMAGLALLGLKKLGFNPIGKIADKLHLSSVKDFGTKIFDNVKTFVTKIFKKH